MWHVKEADITHVNMYAYFNCSYGWNYLCNVSTLVSNQIARASLLFVRKCIISLYIVWICLSQNEAYL